MEKITEKTLIPLSILSLVAGCVFWIASIYYRAEATESMLELVRLKTKENSAEIVASKERIARLEEKITFIYDWVKDKKDKGK